MDLRQLTCVPCQGKAIPVDSDQYNVLLPQLPGWQIAERDEVSMLTKTYDFKHYCQCLELVQRIGELAETHDHHPEMTISWGKVQVSWWTHTVQGLHINDFVLAAGTDEIAAKLGD
jgi:4a-hydroxytetrahydrobiopterin dehydratase